MSIYLALCSLEDYDIEETVLSAISNASRPYEIHIGLAATVGHQFFDSIVHPLGAIQNTHVMHYDPAYFRGIGHGRNNAFWAYDNQDYVVQVDSHTIFHKGWDDFVVALYHNALKETHSDKTIVTGYLSPHVKFDGVVKHYDLFARYCIYVYSNVKRTINMKAWIKKALWEFPDEYDSYRTLAFIPANKIGADFMVSDHHFAEYTGLPRSTIFFEEELIQSINLLDRGFSLVFPNVEIPMTHRYLLDDEPIVRQGTDKLYRHPTEVDERINANLAEFIKNNRELCLDYGIHAGYDLTSAGLTGKIIPNTYALER